MEALKERHGCVTFWLWTILIVNIAMFFYYVVALFTTGSMIGIVGHGLSLIMSLGCILGSILLMRWNKLGFFLFLICQAVVVLLDVFLFHSDPYLIVSLIIAMCIWRGILQMKRNGVSAWKNMFIGWDYQHCRHLYQVFLGLTFIIFLLILFAVVNNANSGTQREDSEEYELLDSIAIDTVAVEVIDSEQYDENSDLAFLKQSIKHIKLPMNAGNGVLITNVYVDSENLVYVAECDEDIIDIDLLKEFKRVTKENIIESILSDESGAMAFTVGMCCNAERGICYRYVGDTSGKECLVVLTLGELRDLLRKIRKTNND